MINRGAFLLRYLPPAVAWINAADPQPGAIPLTLAQANEELTVYLVDDATVDSPEAFRRWLRRHYRGLFELELEGWYPDPATWPKELSFALFTSWFRPEHHSVVVDLADEPVRDEDA